MGQKTSKRTASLTQTYNNLTLLKTMKAKMNVFGNRWLSAIFIIAMLCSVAFFASCSGSSGKTESFGFPPEEHRNWIEDNYRGTVVMNFMVNNYWGGTDSDKKDVVNAIKEGLHEINEQHPREDVGAFRIMFDIIKSDGRMNDTVLTKMLYAYQNLPYQVDSFIHLGIVEGVSVWKFTEETTGIVMIYGSNKDGECFVSLTDSHPVEEKAFPMVANLFQKMQEGDYDRIKEEIWKK